MPAYEVKSPDGKTYRVNAPDGATQEDAISYVQKNFSVQSAKPTEEPLKPFGQQMNEGISDIPHQLGLTARHALTGIGDTADMLASPIRAGLNAVLPDSLQAHGGVMTRLADTLGLPTPNTPTERVVGDASRLLVAGGGMAGAAAKVAPMLTGTGQVAAKALAANPGLQATSSASAGGAGGYVRETGGNEGSQLAVSLAAGIAAPMAGNKLMNVGNSIKNTLASSAATPVQVDIHINNALQDSGMTLGDLPANVQAGMRADVAQALNVGGNLKPDAIRRLADYRLTGATPTAASLTLDPAMVSQQKNLAKLGINSKDAAAQQLGRVENANNQQLIRRLNDLGAGTADDALAGGQKIMAALSERNDTAKNLIGARYDAARATDGRSALLDSHAFTNRFNDLIDEHNLGDMLATNHGGLVKKLNSIAQGDIPLTVDVAEQLKTSIYSLGKGEMNGNVRKALSLVRQSLDETPLINGQGQGAIDAFNKARSLNRAWMGIVEKTPALQAVRDGIEPDKFVQQFITGSGGKSNVMDVAMLKNSIKSSPEAMGAVKGQITSFLKKSALNNSADEVGNISQSAYNKALNSIGDRKLSLFFEPEEVAQLKAIGRVASYEQFQPRGAAVNNSNTAASALATMLDRIGSSPLLSKIPMGKMLAEPVQNISVGIGAKRALNVPGALSGGGTLLPARQPAGLLMSPAILIPPEEKRKRGLLSP